MKGAFGGVGRVVMTPPGAALLAALPWAVVVVTAMLVVPVEGLVDGATPGGGAPRNCSGLVGGFPYGVSYPVDLFSHVSGVEWFYYKGTLFTEEGREVGVLVNIVRDDCFVKVPLTGVDAVVYSPPDFPYITSSASSAFGAAVDFNAPATPLEVSIRGMNLVVNASMSSDGKEVHMSVLSTNFRVDLDMTRLTVNEAGITDGTACAMEPVFGRCFDQHLHSLFNTRARVWLKTGAYEATGVVIEQHIWGALPMTSPAPPSSGRTHSPSRATAARAAIDLTSPNWYWTSFNDGTGTLAFEGTAPHDNGVGAGHLFLGNRTLAADDILIHVLANWTSPITGRTFAQQLHLTSASLGLDAVGTAPPAQEILTTAMNYFEGFASWDVTVNGVHHPPFNGTVETVYILNAFDVNP